MLARLRSPAARAQRSAGPPTVLSAAALTISVIAMVALAATLVPPSGWAWLVLIPIALTTVAAMADQDGWRIRAAMVEVALEQRRHWRHGRIPVTPEAAAAWLDDPANDGATALERAAVMVTARRWTEATAAVELAPVATPDDAVRQLRLRSTVIAMTDPGRTIDVDAVRVAAAGLPADERRYHVLSAAWSQAWLDVVADRPWRERFARVAREFGPSRIRLRYWLVAVALQQLVLPISIALAAAIVLAVVRL